MAANPTPVATSIAALRERTAPAPLVRAGFGDSESFALLQRMANALAQSTLVPQAYQNNLPNCIIALELAGRIGASPLMVAQNLYIVHGKPAWSSQFLIAAINQCGRYTSLRYEWKGEENTDSWSCRAWALEKSTGERVQGAAVTLKMAKDQGWYGRKDSKWPSMTELMMTYRAATYFARTNAPELTMGLRSEDEERDVIDVQETAPGQFSTTTEKLRTETVAGVGDLATAEPIVRRGRGKAEQKPADAVDASPSSSEPAAATEVIDKTTGEVKEAPPVTIDQVLGYIEKAADRDIANEAVDMARSLSKEEYARACEAYNKKWAEVVG